MDLSLFSLNGKNNYWAQLAKFVNEDDWDEVKRAFSFAKKAHQGQKRRSGLAYISHPVWVAKVVAQLKIGKEAIIAALLHDCVEDSQIKVDEIAQEFGDEVALLVDGLTEVREKSKGITMHETGLEVFRKFLFSSVDDVRILIIRLIDKLHNGLTIKYLPKQAQKKYARRVLAIYSPVGEHVGLHYFKKRLDDIAFEILYPKTAVKLKRYLKLQAKDELKALAKVSGKIEEILKINRIGNYKIEGRIKSLYSTYIKIKKKGKDRVKDRVGIRILLETVADCYTVLGLLHAKYRYLADEFDDYISVPKPSGYRSLQTTLQWRPGLTVEIQIRTFEMHEFNEFGPASHIAYKYGQEKNGTGYQWVKNLVKWQNGKNGVNNYQIKVLTDYVYVFTPKGDTIQLPAGSTALDFAYRIHSNLGNRCKGVKINGKIAKISSVLKTGDMVEVLEGKKINANKSWLEFVKTTCAKEHIRRVC